MKHTRKILVALLVLMSILMSLAVVAIPASAAQPTTLYLDPNSNWISSNAWFAAYFFGNGDTWVKMTDSNGDGIYEVAVPTDKTYPSVIFVRMDPSKTTASWDSDWNQTSDLTIPTNGNNCYTVADGAWSKGSGSWGKMAYTVVGATGLCGSDWTTTDTSNDMLLNSEGLYEKVYSKIDSGTYEFKVAANHGWRHSWGKDGGADNTSVTVDWDNSNVTVYFDPVTKAITTKVEHIHTWVDGACSICSEACTHSWVSGECETCSTVCSHSYDNACDTSCNICESTRTITHVYDNACDADCNVCGVTRTPADHTYVDGTCSVCGEKDPDYVAPVVVTLSVPDEVDSVEMGEGNVLPTAGAPEGYTFAGWSESTINETTTKPTILEAGNVYNGEATVLYAVYTRKETTPGTSIFEKVTSAPSDWSGSYLIVYEAGKVAFNGALTTFDAVSNTVGITINNGTITVTTTLKDAMFTIAKSGSSYTIKSASGYYIGNTADSNKLNSSTSTKYTNTITLNSDGSVQIVGSGKSVLRYNSASDQLRFRYYKSSTYTAQKAIHLYKLTETAGSSVTYYLTMSTVECDHSYESVVTDPTCTTAGYTTHTCSKCGDKYTDNEIPAIDHSHVESITTAATCTTAGLKTFTCSCGDSYTEEIKALGHNYVDGVCSRCSAKEPVISSEATITFDNTEKRTEFGTEKQVWVENGITVTNNKASGDSVANYSNPVRFYKNSEVIIAYPGMVKIEVTCNTAAYATALVESIKNAFVTVEGKLVTITLDSVADTFTVTLSAGQVRVDSITVYAVCVHTNTTTTTEDSTCTVAGSKTEVCDDCGTTISSETLELADHTPGEAVEENRVESTCTVAGSYDSVVYCSVCKTHKISSTKVDLELAAHSFDDGVCSDCGAKQQFIIVSDATIENIGDEYKNIITEIQTSGALVNFAPTNVPSGANLVIELTDMDVVTGVPGTIVFEVAPMKDGAKVQPDEAITFRLPVPANVTKAFAKVYHEGELMGIYAIQEANGSKYVELSSKEFSEYSVEPVDAVAKIGETNYATLQDAENAAIDGDTIVLLKDIELNKAVTFFNSASARMITLDMNGKTITLQNDYHVFYVCDGLTITGNGKIVAAPTEGYDWAHTFIVGYRKSGTTTGNAGNLIIMNGSFYSNDATVVSVTNGSVAIYGGTFESAGYLDLNCIDDMYAAGKASITVYGGSFVGFNPENNASEGASTDFCAEDYTAVEAEGVYTVVKAVAKIGDTKFASLEEAFAEALEGETITLLTDATPDLNSQCAITKAAVINLNGHTLTLTEDDLYFGTTTFENGTIVVDPSVKPSTAVFWMFKDQTLTFDGVKLVATGVTGTYLIGLDGNNSDLNIINGSEILVENDTALDLDIICVNASTGNDILVKDSKVNVSNLDGRVFFRGNYTISGTSEVVLDGITKAGFRIEAGQTLSIEDTSSVTITGEPRDGGIHLTDTTATYTKADTATVSSTLNIPAPNYVAEVNGVKYTDIQEAIKAAAPAGTVELLSDVTVDTWIMIAEKLSIGNGKLITLNVNGLTIDGNGYTLTVNDIESAGNGSYLFYDAENLNVQDLTIKLADGLAGIGLQSGNITGVTFEGGAYGVIPGTGEITIEGCTFKTNSSAIYYEQARDNLVVNNNRFELATTANVILLRGTEQFTNNTVVSGRTVNVVSGSPVVSGNDFGDVRLKVYNSATATITENTINNLVFNDETTTYTIFENNILSESAKAALDAVLPVYVAKVDGVEYESLADALAAASSMTGDVVVEILDKVTLTQSLTGSYDSITFVGKDTDAEIYLDVQGYITATGKNVAFEDLTLSKSAGGFITNAGFMNVAFGVYDVTEVTYTDCTFANGAYASSGDVNFTGCTFYRSHDKYGLWAYGDANIVVDDCTFADYRGIKMYAEGGAKVTDLTVKNTDFSALDSKPAIVLTYGESVTLEGNTYSSTGVFELDLDGAPNGTVVKIPKDTTCKNDNGACGVLVDGKIYTTVADAAAVATSGSTVTLLHDSTETVELAEGVILDKNGYTAEGVTVKVFYPQGNLQIGYITTQFGGNAGVHGIYGEAVKVMARESFKVELYYGDTLVGIAELVDNDKVLLNGESCTISWHILVGEDNDSWWNTSWVGGALNVNSIPNKAVLYVDGENVSECEIVLHSADDSYPIIGAVTDADGNVQNFVAADGYTNNIKNVGAKLNSAIAAANAGDTIVLLTDITVSETVNVTKAINIDLNGKTITSTAKCAVQVSGGNQDLAVTISNGKIVAAAGSASNGTSALSVYDGADVVLNDVELSGGYYGIKLAGYNGYISDVNKNNLTSVVINGGYVTAENAAIIGLGAYPNTQIDINGATITSTDSIAIYHPSYGTLNITGGTITGTTAIYMKAGNLNISGGNIVANGEAADYEYNYSGASATGDAIVIESCNYGGYPTPVVSITGGTFTSANNKAVASYNSEDAEAVTGFIYGGKFSTDVSDYLADGYHLNDDGSVTEHSYDAGVVFKPTCTEDGYTIYTCVCDHVYIADEVPALGHTEVVDAAVAATCTETGLTEGKHCSVCDKVLVAQEEVPALGHNYVDGECTVCHDVILVQVGDKYYKTFKEALDAIADGGEITLYDDVTLSEILVLSGDTVLNGNGHKIHSSAARVINVNSNGTVVIKNLTITTNSNNARTTLSVAERAINVIQQGVTLTIDNVIAEGFKYAVNVAASSVGSNITINDSIISGYAAINITGNNTTMVVNNSTLTGINETVGKTNDFAVISIGDNTTEAATENVSLTVNGGKLIAITGENKQATLQISDATGTYAYIDAELVLANGEVLADDSTSASVFFRAEYADELAARGYITKAVSGDMISVTEKLPYFIGEDGYWYFNGAKTDFVAVGIDGDKYTIGKDGYWYLNGDKTEHQAVAKDADQYTIGKDGYWYLNNVKTEYQAIGKDGKDYTIVNGEWYLNNEPTGLKAVGTDGVQYTIGDDGYWYKDGVITEYYSKGQDGKTPKFQIIEGNLYAIFEGEEPIDLGKVVADAPTISENGNWIIAGVETTISALGKDAKEYTIGEDGFWYLDGEKTEFRAIGIDGKTPTFKIESGNLFVTYDGENWTDLGQIVGKDGITPHIGENGNWWIGNTDTGVKAEGKAPHIGENGNWWIGNTDTGVKAENGNLKNEIVICLLGVAALFLITMIVALATRKYRGRRWWILT